MEKKEFDKIKAFRQKHEKDPKYNMGSHKSDEKKLEWADLYREIENEINEIDDRDVRSRIDDKKSGVRQHLKEFLKLENEEFEGEQLYTWMKLIKLFTYIDKYWDEIITYDKKTGRVVQKRGISIFSIFNKPSVENLQCWTNSLYGERISYILEQIYKELDEKMVSKLKEIKRRLEEFALVAWLNLGNLMAGFSQFQIEDAKEYFTGIYDLMYESGELIFLREGAGKEEFQEEFQINSEDLLLRTWSRIVINNICNEYTQYIRFRNQLYPKMKAFLQIGEDAKKRLYHLMGKSYEILDFEKTKQKVLSQEAVLEWFETDEVLAELLGLLPNDIRENLDKEMIINSLDLVKNFYNYYCMPQQEDGGYPIPAGILYAAIECAVRIKKRNLSFPWKISRTYVADRATRRGTSMKSMENILNEELDVQWYAINFIHEYSTMLSENECVLEQYGEVLDRQLNLWIQAEGLIEIDKFAYFLALLQLCHYEAVQCFTEEVERRWI